MKKYIGSLVIAGVLLVAPQAKAASINDALIDLLIQSFVSYLLETGTLTQGQVDLILAAGQENNTLSQDNTVRPSYDFGDDEEYAAVYDVVNGSLRERDGDVDSALDEDIWELFEEVAGKEFVEDYVVEYFSFDNEEDDTEAYVQASDESIAHWRFAINRAGKEGYLKGDKEFDQTVFETVVHEFAHILNFNPTQVDENVSRRNCRTHYVAEGCPKGDSYYALFVERFWSEKDIEGVEEDEDYAEELYEDNTEKFVSGYAATDPGEDFAETFAFFVSEQTAYGNDGRDGGDKILWMYDQDDLVQWRSDILKRTGM